MKRKAKVDPHWIRSRVDHVAIAQGCYFDERAGERACEFIETFCKQSQGEWKGKAIELLDWQRDFIMRLFGWKAANGFRRYKCAYLEVAKKNGKSTLISALVLLLLLADGEGTPKVYLNACDKDQTDIVFGESRRMIAASEDLKSRLVVINSKADKRIIHEEGDGEIICNSSVAGSKDGLNPHGIIFDELHRQIDRKLWDVFEHASASRRQALTISITTAGESAEGVWHEQRELSELNNRDDIPDADLDISHLGVVYRALPEDDPSDPKTWRKANPSLGVTIQYEEMERKWLAARKDPVKRANFLRLRLNVIQREDKHFFEPGQWEACGEPAQVSPGDLCWAGLDLSSTNDLSALIAIFKNELDGFDVRAWFWLPEDNIIELERRHRQPYRIWAEQGHITLTDGPSIDYRFIRQEIKRIAKEYQLVKLLADPDRAQNLLAELLDDDGLPVDYIRQGMRSLSPPTIELRRLVERQAIRHGNNPILNWMARNVMPVTDDNENIRFSKRKSREKIDGMAALVNAIGAGMANDDGGSVYDRRDPYLIGGD